MPFQHKYQKQVILYFAKGIAPKESFVPKKFSEDKSPDPQLLLTALPCPLNNSRLELPNNCAPFTSNCNVYLLHVQFQVSRIHGVCLRYIPGIFEQTRFKYFANKLKCFTFCLFKCRAKKSTTLIVHIQYWKAHRLVNWQNTAALYQSLAFIQIMVAATLFSIIQNEPPSQCIFPNC